MEAFGRWFVRLIGGWIPLGDKPISEWFGKIVWVVGIILAFHFVMQIFVKQPANKNQPTVYALPFSKVGDIDLSNDQKNEENKRKWWQPIPYVSVAGQSVMTSVGTESGAKVEAGLRWDF